MFRRSSVFDEGRMKRFRSANSAGLTEMNYWGSGADGSVTISANTTWDSTSSGDMIVKNFADFTVNSGLTLTIKARKGCLIYVKGNFVNNGTIRVQSGYSCDPSLAGVLSTGLRIIRVKSGSSETLSASDLTGCGTTAINAEANQNAINGNGKIYIISRTGASGGSRSAATNQAGVAGSNGSSGATLQTGGGGSGGTGGSVSVAPGPGGSGTCFSGGAGGGGSQNGGYPGTAGSSIGGAGGGPNSYGYAGGGAGNPNGTWLGSGTITQAEAKIGGLIIMFVKGAFANAGTISMPGGNGSTTTYTPSGNGGASGGGAGLFLYGENYSNTGTISATGGIGLGTYKGGNGGAGSVLIEQILL